MSSLFEMASCNDINGIKSVLTRENVFDISDGGWGAIHYFTNLNNLDGIKLCLALGCNVNLKTTYGSTPLALAVVRNHIEVVRFLIDVGANVNYQNNDGYTPIDYCHDANCSWDDILYLLMDRGANFELSKRGMYERAKIYLLKRENLRKCILITIYSLWPKDVGRLIGKHIWSNRLNQ